MNNTDTGDAVAVVLGYRTALTFYGAAGRIYIYDTWTADELHAFTLYCRARLVDGQREAFGNNAGELVDGGDIDGVPVYLTVFPEGRVLHRVGRRTDEQVRAALYAAIDACGAGAELRLEVAVMFDAVMRGDGW